MIEPFLRHSAPAFRRPPSIATNSARGSRSTPWMQSLSAMMLLIGAGLLPAACGGDDAGDSSDADATPAATATPAAIDASFTHIRDDILIPSCGFSSCHGSGTAGLTIDESSTYEDLVGAASLELPDMLRVAPNDVDASYLIWKLEDREGIIGDEMPPGSLLPEESLASIRAWIEAGAPND